MFYLKQNMYIHIKPFLKLKQLLLPLLHTLKHLTKHTAFARPLCYHGSQHQDTLSELKIRAARAFSYSSDTCRSAEEVKRSHADRCRSLNTVHATPPPHTDRKETLGGFESLLGACLRVCVCVPSVAVCVGTAVCLLYHCACVCVYIYACNMAAIWKRVHIFQGNTVWNAANYKKYSALMFWVNRQRILAL